MRWCHGQAAFDARLRAGGRRGQLRLGLARADLSPAVVTRLVADLEEHLGARLINRTTRHLSLTDTGEAYLERVRHVLTEVDEAEALADRVDRRSRAAICACCARRPSPCTSSPSTSRCFASAIRWSSLELSAPGPVETVDENFDVSILTEGRAPARRQLRRQAAGAHRGHHLRRARIPRPARPAGAPEGAGPARGDGAELHARADLPYPQRHRRNGASRSPSRGRATGLSTIHTDTLYAAALAGMGITGLPSFVAEDALLENALERVLPRWHLLSTTLYAGMPTRKHVPARTRAFVDFLVQTFGGEDRDPWLSAAGCETPISAPQGPPAHDRGDRDQAGSLVVFSIQCANAATNFARNARVRVVRELAVLVEHLGRAADVGLRLVHRRHVQEHQRLAQVVVGAEAADGARRIADHRAPACRSRRSCHRGASRRRWRSSARRAPSGCIPGVTNSTASAALTCSRNAVHLGGRRWLRGPGCSAAAGRCRRSRASATPARAPAGRCASLRRERFLAEAADDDGDTSGLGMGGVLSMGR